MYPKVGGKVHVRSRRGILYSKCTLDSADPQKNSSRNLNGPVRTTYHEHLLYECFALGLMPCHSIQLKEKGAFKPLVIMVEISNSTQNTDYSYSYLCLPKVGLGLQVPHLVCLSLEL